MKGWTPYSVAGAVVLLIGLAGAFFLTPPSPSEVAEGGSLPKVSLASLAGQKTPLASCSSKKCLTVVVAPWCGYCRASTSKIVELEKYLESKKVDMRVVVSMDKPGPLADYAQEFGPKTLLDLSGQVLVRGVPHFILTDDSGNVLETAAGIPPGGIQDVREFAARFGLP